MSLSYEIASVQTDLKRKTASVRLRQTTGYDGGVSVSNFPFDPAGQQTENELETLAVAEAKRLLTAALASLG